MQRAGADMEDIDFHHFCLLLDAGLSTNPSRVSSFLSTRGMSRAISFFKKLEGEGLAISDSEKDNK